MLLAGKHAQERTERRVKAPLLFLRWEFRNCWLLANEPPEFRNQIHNELPIQVQGVPHGLAPAVGFLVALAQDLTYQGLEGLRQSGIRYVPLVLVELTRGE